MAEAVIFVAAFALTLFPPGPRDNCVVDGDTFWLSGEKIRIADIDMPEVNEPQCAAEKVLGDRATRRLLELLKEGPFELRQVGTRDRDRHGRLLSVVI